MLELVHKRRGEACVLLELLLGESQLAAPSGNRRGDVLCLVN
jgi:hypothetical protein